MRLVICWNDAPGYAVACWRALARRAGMELTVITAAAGSEPDIPLHPGVFEGIDGLMLQRSDLADPAHMGEIVAALRADVVALCGWAHRGYRALPWDRRLAHCRFILAMDTPLQLTWRQWFGRLLLRPLLSRIDRVFVPGERAAALARYYGVPGDRIRRGSYGIDYDLLRSARTLRAESDEAVPPRFLFLGRYVPTKGLDLLLEAYRRYRGLVAEPWDLTCAGRGPLRDMLAGQDGVTDVGFTPPGNLPALLARHSVLVQPSRFEPWGQVIVEACAAGMVVIATDACGAAVEVVHSFHNGLLVPTGQVEALVHAMLWIHQRRADVPEFGRRSSEIAAAYSAERWADIWEQTCRELVGASAAALSPPIAPAPQCLGVGLAGVGDR
jgi:glycosyltransferase involved in cell wall biosynthesis